MLNYSEGDIKRFLIRILNREDFNILPVGNHYLNRHLVYKIYFSNSDNMIFKLYYKTGRRSREIASLRFLENSAVKAPRIIDFGQLDSGEEWILMECIVGQVFDNISNVISEDEKQLLFQEIGEELGKIHSITTFDYFGNWDEKGNSLKKAENWYELFVEGMEFDIADIEKKVLPHKNLLDKAIKMVRRNYDVLNISPLPRLTHNDYDGRNILVKPTTKGYTVSGIIDFEQCRPGNCETDLVGLYYRYFFYNSQFESAFLEGYNKFFVFDDNFKERLLIHLLCFIIGNTTWSFEQAPKYYEENMMFLMKLLNSL
jgi:aminoglycoside phosphotransferase (APT) family kinase protein